MDDGPHSQEDAFGLPPAAQTARFYFDVREGERFIPDHEGLACAGLEQAEREAAQSVAEIAKDRLPAGHVREISVEVRDERGQRVLTVTITMTVSRA